MLLRACLLVALATVACGAPAVVGGEIAHAGREPPGRRVASFRTTACVDAAGGALSHTARVFLADDEAKHRMLVVARPSYDSIVLREPRSEGGESVFQVILEDGDGGRVLHDYRVPTSGTSNGRMAVTRQFAESTALPGKVSAKVFAIAFACQLVIEQEPKAEP